MVTRKEGRTHPPEPVPIKNIEVALVLSGGGARGVSHVGVLEVLQQNKIPIDLIVATSIGSVVGAMYADGICIDELKKRVMNLKREHLVNVQLGSATGIFIGRHGMSSGDKFKNFLLSNLRAKYFSELKIPFVAVATNINDFSAYEFRSGEIYHGIMASAAVPPIFPPVAVYGSEFIDGGVVEPTPVRIAKRYNPKMIIAVDISDRGMEKVNTMYDIINKSFYVMYYELSDMQASMADVVIHPNLNNFGMFDDNHHQELFSRGKEEALKMLPQIKNRMEKLGIKSRESVCR
jgi:NTE family protein